MRQKSLFLAQGEACCFYVNQSGLIRESSAMVTYSLQKKEKGNAKNLATGTNLCSSGPPSELFSLELWADFGSQLSWQQPTSSTLLSHVKQRINSVNLLVLRRL